jgi:hypothetical protein
MTSTMSHELICGWLGLSPGEWPPDHYRLLGLDPADTDPQQIEQHVHQRLEQVRRYQLLHPELVTEAMNRLAQAFVCLTDPEARRAYDSARAGKALVVVPEPGPVSPPRPETILVVPMRVGARSRPNLPLVPLPAAAAAPADAGTAAVPPLPSPLAETATAPLAITAPQLPVLPEIPPLPAALPAGEPEANGEGPGPAAESEGAPLLPTRVDPAVEAAQSSRAARRGLGTKRALYRRLAATRRLQRAWDRLGRYLADPRKRLTRPSEATELINLLKDLAAALENFPPLLGRAGQPGYSVVVLARQAVPVPIYQTLLPSQRETLAQHWQSGLQLLASHRDFLRREIGALRKKNVLGRSWRAVRAAVTDQPGALLLLLALIALNVAVWRQFVVRDWLEDWGSTAVPSRTAPANEPR